MGIEVECAQCGGEMEKDTITSGRAAGCLQGLIVFLCGLAVAVCFFWTVIGGIIGVLIMLYSLTMGAKHSHVMRCIECGYFYERHKKQPKWVVWAWGIPIAILFCFLVSLRPETPRIPDVAPLGPGARRVPAQPQETSISAAEPPAERPSPPLTLSPEKPPATPSDGSDRKSVQTRSLFDSAPPAPLPPPKPPEPLAVKILSAKRIGSTITLTLEAENTPTGTDEPVMVDIKDAAGKTQTVAIPHPYRKTTKSVVSELDENTLEVSSVRVREPVKRSAPFATW